MSPQQKTNWGVIVTLVLALLGWAFTGLRSYSDDTSTLRERVTVVETKEDAHERQFELLREDLKEVRGDIKTLLERR